VNRPRPDHIDIKRVKMQIPVFRIISTQTSAVRWEEAMIRSGTKRWRV
jgi:hypothetical protein